MAYVKRGRLGEASLPRRARRAAGFSLLELVIVLGLVIFLAVMVDDHYSISGRKKALLGCQANLQKIYLAMSLYQNDNKDAWPVVKDAKTSAVPLSLLVPKDTSMTEIFICPGSRDKSLPEAESFANRKISYAYYMGRTPQDAGDEIILSDAQVDSAPKRSGQQLFSKNGEPPGNNHDTAGGNLLSRNGEVTKSGVMASRDLLFPPTVHLLNPE